MQIKIPEFKFNAITLISIIYLTVCVAYTVNFIPLWLKLLGGNTFFSAVAKNPFYACDYNRYYLAAYLTAHGYGHDFFDPGLQDKLYVSLIPNLMPFDRYIDYPPYLGVVLLPLLLLAINNGYIVFTLLSVLFFFYSLYKLNNELGYLTKFNFIAYGFGVFACTLTMYNILIGQLNFLLFGCLNLFIIALAKYNDFKYSLTTFLLVCKPHYFCFFYPLLLMVKKNRLFLAGLFVLAFLLVLSVLITGFDNTFNYPKILYEIHTNYTYHGTKLTNFTLHKDFLVSLRYLIDSMFTTSVANYVSLACLALGSLAAWFFMKKCNFNDREEFNWYISVLILAFCLISPHFFQHDLLILAIPALLTLKTLDLNKIIHYEFNYKIWCLIFYFYPALSWVIALTSGGNSSRYDYREISNLLIDLILFGLALNQYFKIKKGQA